MVGEERQKAEKRFLFDLSCAYERCRALPRRSGNDFRQTNESSCDNLRQRKWPILMPPGRTKCDVMHFFI